MEKGSNQYHHTLNYRLLLLGSPEQSALALTLPLHHLHPLTALGSSGEHLRSSAWNRGPAATAELG